MCLSSHWLMAWGANFGAVCCFVASLPPHTVSDFIVLIRYTTHTQKLWKRHAQSLRYQKVPWEVCKRSELLQLGKDTIQCWYAFPRIWRSCDRSNRLWLTKLFLARSGMIAKIVNFWYGGSVQEGWWFDHNHDHNQEKLGIILCEAFTTSIKIQI